MRALIFDPFAGISGDMILGGLVDLGLPADWLQSFVGSLGFEGVSVVVERVRRRGISCGRVRFELPHEHAHRHLSDVLALVDACQAPEPVKARAREAFQRLAAAEAAIHGTTVERVHFHEVGALDAILDVLCAMAGVAELGFEAFYTRPVTVGQGWVDIAHGKFPLPAPATLKLLEGVAIRDAGWPGECTTPTGAAVLVTLTSGQAPPPEVRVLGSGFGAGSRDPEDRPNCLRLISCEVPDAPQPAVHVVQADIDDMPAEYLPPAQEALYGAGAVDVTLTSVMMKKGRPGWRLEALVPEPALAGVVEALFRNTSTIGARHWPVARSVLERAEEVVDWHGQEIRLKRVRLPGGGERAKPESEDVIAAARASGMAPYEVRRAIEREVSGLPGQASPE